MGNPGFEPESCGSRPQMLKQTTLISHNGLHRQSCTDLLRVTAYCHTPWLDADDKNAFDGIRTRITGLEIPDDTRLHYKCINEHTQNRTGVSWM